MWQWLVRLYHRLGSPKWFYEMTERWIFWLALAAGGSAIVGLVLGLLYAPADYQQGDSFRIIYIHVPAALLAQSAYMMMAVAGAVYLIWRMKMAAWVAKVIAPVGAAFCLIALLTGAIWGKPTWGTWWVWDARLTSMLMLLFLYFGVMALQQAMESEEASYKAGAILALVGLVNIPIIKYSVEWWNTLHQPATLKLTEKPSMHPDMLWPLLIMIVSTYLFFALVVILRTRNEILWHERKRQWVRKILES
ncbi:MULTISPECIES: heme ABC transporter permease [Thalassolituus]|jgi:heme exporter protein C|uniref:Heme exporter protein C n=3 Tax=Thalassolituus TaxID=187492 RepID=A0A1N7J7Z5_9GAMM|nr:MULTISPECIES: heme ABC transporter permease [Thalassolituus]KZY96164.1 heme ABC transporter permease [Oleibacter sp. HI0075]MAX86814.1 heme ABC transporter permease [Oceanospirillaceae bacterium]MEC9254984.1 heme ABC transporter permease [Pseudomonadota bacterium]MBN57231.1 heme ABC transporter permease [Oceanospirillaceae bacterium]MDQ4424594.1 heme ABC transporter permease [Thalassolituus sp.]